LGMFNLIVGDNNIGKTSLLEALLFTANRKEYLQRLAFAHIERVNIYPDKEQSSLSNNNILYYDLNEDFLKEIRYCGHDESNIEFLISNGRNKWKYELTFFDEEIKQKDYTILSFEKEDYRWLDNVPYLDGIKQPFMSYGKGFGEELAFTYNNEIRPKRKVEREFMENMKLFIPNISQIYAGPDGKIDIRDDDFPEDRPLHQYGEGVNKLFRILILLTLNKGKRLMIDEIDAGLHYSKFKEFWKLVIKIAKRDETQIFATTHNDECIRYFTEVLDELEEEYQTEARVVQMKLVNNKVKIRSYEHESFSLAIEEGVEIRGGQIL
jgi:AAA15 family ATPase/GTPase